MEIWPDQQEPIKKSGLNKEGKWFILATRRGVCKNHRVAV
jgi:hypothetical protein